MKSLYRISTVALVCTSLSACSQRIASTDPATANVAADTPVEIGKPLFAANYAPFQQSAAQVQPVVIPSSQIVILRKEDLPSKVDGTVYWIGVEVDEATASKLSKSEIFVHPRTKATFRRLQPGDRVKRDQVVALIDDERAYVDSVGADLKMKSAADEVKAYEVAVDRVQRLVMSYKSAKADAVSNAEVFQAEATLARQQAEAIGRQGALKTAEAEHTKAKLILDQHTLRAAIDGEIQLVAKNEGEGVKVSEPILVIHNFDQLRAEGNLPKEYIGTIRPGDEVILETPADLHAGITFDQHTTNKPITAVKVGTRPGGAPIIVSAGEDGWVYAWERNLKVAGSWKQSGAVRALAVTPPGTERSLLLVGCDTGSARLYDLATISPQPILELDGKHDGGVVAAAFSPDGKYLVTADERNIYLWDTATGKKKYDFNSREHRSLITSLNFTKQGRVISAARDQSILVWIVGEEGAKVEHRFDARSGDVAQPGVSDDGSRLLLDADKTRLDVIHLKDGRKERPIVTGGESARFHTFTAWSPELSKGDATRLIATTSSNDGVVQLWRAPTPTTRGAEVARLITRGGAQVTDAAFSPSGEQGFIVVGTKKGDVYLWDLPNTDELKSELRSTVTHVENLIESSGRTSRVLVDFANPQRNGNYMLRPGSTVTIVIQPSLRK